MPNTGYQTTSLELSVRPGLIDWRAIADEQQHGKSWDEELVKRDWRLVAMVLFTMVFGVTVWSALIYKVWHAVL